MMKWIVYLLVGLLVAFGWWRHLDKSASTKELEAKITQLQNTGVDEDEELPGLLTELNSRENEKTFTGILLAFLTAGLVGVIAVVHIVPLIAQRFTHVAYDSAEMVEQDPMHDARAKVAQGDYEGAIEAFKLAADAEPMNRLPWVEISKIQRDNLEQPQAAIATLRHALERQEWELNDAAYLLFRLAELYDGDMNDRTSAATTLQQVMEQFPNTRHSANARHRLHEWGLI